MNSTLEGGSLAILSAVVWAVAVSRYSLFAAASGPFAVSFARTVVGAALFFCASLAWGNLGSLTLTQVLWLSASVLGSYTLGDALFFWCSRQLGVPSALAIGSCFPFWAAVAGILWLDQAMTVSKGIGMCLVVGGTIGVILSSPARELGKSHTPGKKALGVLGAIVVSMAWALNSFASAKGAIGISIWDANFVRMSAGMIGNAAVISLIGARFPKGADFKSHFGLFFFETFIGSAAYVAAMSQIPLGIAATLASLAPVISVPIAIYQRRERFMLNKLIAMIVALAGIALLVL